MNTSLSYAKAPNFDKYSKRVSALDKEHNKYNVNHYYHDARYTQVHQNSKTKLVSYD